MKNWVMMTVFYALMILVNGLGSTGNINGQSQEEISNRLDVLFTPAGYVFSIWGLIYVLLLIWLISQFRRIHTEQTPQRIVYLFIGTCVFNMLWLFTWHYEIFIAAQLMMFALLINLILLYVQYPTGDKSFGGRLPFSFYLGWISVATIASMCYTCKHYEITLGSEVFVTIVLIIVAMLLAVAILFFHRDPFFALVVVWALIGIGVANTDSSLVLVAYICAALVAIAVATALLRFKKRRVV